jgi:hypothetical protein
LLKVDKPPKPASFSPYPVRPRGGGDDDDELYDVRLVELDGERVTTLLLLFVSMEPGPGFARNTCSSGIRDKDMNLSFLKKISGKSEY